MKKLSHLTRTSIMLGFFFGLDKVLAFVRSIVIAREFRNSITLLDTFNAANNLPDLLFALISGGALAMAFIPLMSEYLTKQNRDAAWDLFSRVANLAFVATSTFAIVIAIFAEPIARFGIVPGFPPDQQQILVELMRLNLIGTVIFSISGLVMASLQANQHFFLPALAPIFYNVGQIFGAIYLAPRFGVQGLVYGVIIGAVMHLLIQIPGLAMYHFRWTPSLDLRHTGLLEALRLIGPRILTMFGIQAMFMLRDNLASLTKQTGAVTSLTYGWMIMQVPETLIGTAVATAILPTLAELASRDDWTGFRQTIEKAFRVMIALSLPIAAVMAAGIHPLVRAVFGFDEAGTSLLTWTSRVYLITLCGYTMQEVTARAFYARKEAWFPFFGVVARLIIYVTIGAIAVIYFKNIGAPVIALAEISLTVEAVFMLVLLNRRISEPVSINGALVRGLIAALIGGGITYGLAVILPGSAVLTALLGMVIGGLVALAIVWVEARLLFKL
ncbi:MAG TPA: murein biosynthesis integral membrane protein MurJ [Anaerolineales bacterium]|nr:murein biosynthesis integral membrane protein MurJ [Anaerolineales bacterium]